MEDRQVEEQKRSPALENSQDRETSPYMIAGGIAVVVVVILLGLGLLARTQIPVETVTVSANDDVDSDAAISDEDAPDTAEADTAEGSASDATAASDDLDDTETEEPETEEPQTEEPEIEVAEAESTEASSADDSTQVQEASADSESDTAEVVPVSSEGDSETSLPAVDMSNDELILAFASGGCSACHMIPNIAGAVGQLGPDLTNIGTAAGTRIEGLSAVEYIRQSVLEPAAYFVEECPIGPCQAELDQTAGLVALSDQEIDGMVNYLALLTDDGQILASTEGAAAEGTAAEDTVAEDTADEDAVAEDTAAEDTAAEEPEPVAEEEPTEPEPLDMAAVSSAITKGTCGACHVIPGVDGAAGVVGPNLTEIGTVAATRIDGYTAEEYLYESIVDPNAFIAPECPAGDCFANVMLPNLVDLLTDDEIDIIVRYLGSLQ